MMNHGIVLDLNIMIYTLTTNECMDYFKERREGIWKSFNEAVDHRIHFVQLNETNWKLN